MLFGKKVPLSLNQTSIIGDFVIEASVFENVSGVCGVSFYLEGNCIAVMVKEPYTAYCDISYSSTATAKACAQDFRIMLLNRFS